MQGGAVGVDSGAVRCAGVVLHARPVPGQSRGPRVCAIRDAGLVERVSCCSAARYLRCCHAPGAAPRRAFRPVTCHGGLSRGRLDRARPGHRRFCHVDEFHTTVQ